MSRSAPIIPVILCGGSGTRLWPLSRESYPKQFHRFVGTHTLFEDTILRAAALGTADSPILEIAIVCNEAHRFMALANFPQLFQVVQFLEKPHLETAKALLATRHPHLEQTRILLQSIQNKEQSAIQPSTAVGGWATGA